MPTSSSSSPARTIQPGAKGLSSSSPRWPTFRILRGRVLDKVGQRGQDTRELFFENMRVPVENVLGGEEGRGFVHLMQQLPQERLSIAVGAAAVCEYAVREATAYSKEREAFGTPILSFQNTKFVLAECATEAYSVRAFTDHLVAEHIAGRLTTEQASAGKYWATDAQNRVVDRCLQVFGGYGYMVEYPIARLYADARVQKIYGGTNEIMKELISRGL